MSSQPFEPSPCLDLPELKRLRYFYGQVLGPQDFQDEQTYFREKLKLHNRCLHGYGTVCGLEVVPEPVAEDCDPPGRSEREALELELKELENLLVTGRFPSEEARRKVTDRVEEIRRRLRCLPQDAGRPAPRTRVRIRCGLAYDCAGNELVVRRDLPVDLLAHLAPEEARQMERDGTPVTLWLSLCHCEQPVDPARPVLSDACGASPDCVFGKLRDAVRVRVSREQPQEDQRCDACCSACADPCLLLAQLNGVVPGKALTPEQIDNGVRRPLSTYLPTRIAAVSWSHGAEYTVEETRKLLDTLEIHFTRPVLSSTIRPGVMDVWIIEGGGGRHADIYNRDGTPEAAASPLTDRLLFRKGTDESLQDGDRVLITLRTAFLLDRCCRPVDGENVGGRVPILKGSAAAREPVGGPLAECLRPLGGFGPWTSGDSSPAGTFESWFFVKRGGTQ